LFHENQKDGGCPFWDASKNKFQPKAYLKHRSVRQINADGSSSVSGYWIKKLQQWTFPNLKILADADKEKIIKELRDTAAKLPTATKSEIDKFMTDSQRYVGMAMAEDNSYINMMRNEVAILSNAVKIKQKASRQRSRVTQRKAEGDKYYEEDSDESDGGSGWGTDDYSDEDN
jgi:hypothetical protein